MQKYSEVCWPTNRGLFQNGIDHIVSFFHLDVPIVSLCRRANHDTYYIRVMYDLTIDPDSGLEVTYALFIPVTRAELLRFSNKEITILDMLLDHTQVYMSETFNDPTYADGSYLIQDIALLGNTLPSNESYYDPSAMQWSELDSIKEDEIAWIKNIFEPTRPE